MLLEGGAVEGASVVVGVVVPAGADVELREVVVSAVDVGSDVAVVVAVAVVGGGGVVVAGAGAPLGPASVVCTAPPPPADAVAGFSGRTLR